VPSSNIYESPRLLDEYLLFHYAKESEILPANEIPYPAAMRDALGFTQRTVAHFDNTSAARGLDLGCAVGASTFAMAENCDAVIGIDFSHAFIHAADQLRAGELLSFHRHDEAMRKTELATTEIESALREKVNFEQGDAMNLRADLGEFDRVHAANLLCRLTRPSDLLEKFPTLVKPSGELIIATPCTWLQEFTPPQHWPTPDTFSWLRQQLEKNFTLEISTHEPFLIRETARKFQWSLSQLTKWRRHA
jgi:2-polyprenyl-3-methyl-5-hydroxy-6-metoxy-1,4-benzoquinol methylase